jgi:hypothetical protein
MEILKSANEDFVTAGIYFGSLREPAAPLQNAGYARHIFFDLANQLHISIFGL